MFFYKNYLVFALLCATCLVTIILTAVGGFALSMAGNFGKEKPVASSSAPIPHISDNLQEQLNSAFSPEFPFNFDAVGNPFVDKTNVSAAQSSAASVNRLNQMGNGTKLNNQPTVLIPNYPKPSVPPLPVSTNTTLPPANTGVSSSSNRSTPSLIDAKQLLEERNRSIKLGRPVGQLSEVYSIDDVKPYGTVGTGNRNYVKFYAAATKDRLTVTLGAHFRDGVVEAITDEGVKFRRTSGEIVFSRWIKNIKNEGENSTVLRVTAPNTP